MARKRTTEWVRVADINIHPEYQRAQNPAKVRRIAAELNPDLLGLPQLSRRDDGTLWAVDGGHRISALRRLGWDDQLIECQVITGLAAEEEAARFLGLNDSIKIGAVDRFRARVLADEPYAVAINEVVERCGFVVRLAPGDGMFCAVNAAEKVFRGGSLDGSDKHPDVLAWTVDTLKSAWGLKSHAVNGDLVEGLGRVRLRGEDIDQSRMVKKLTSKGGGPDAVLGDARALRNIYGGSVAQNVAEVLVGLYNIGLRSNQLSPFRRAAS